MENNLMPKEQFNKFFEEVSNALINKEYTDERMANLTLEELLKENGVEMTLPDSFSDKMRPILTKKLNEDFEANACGGCAACALCTFCGEANGLAGAVGIIGVAAI